MLEFEVSKRDSYRHNVVTTAAGQIIHWTFSTKKKSIGFGLFYKASSYVRDGSPLDKIFEKRDLAELRAFFAKSKDKGCLEIFPPPRADTRSSPQTRKRMNTIALPSMKDPVATSTDNPPPRARSGSVVFRLYHALLMTCVSVHGLERQRSEAIAGRRCQPCRNFARFPLRVRPLDH